MVQCIKLNKEAEGLSQPPFPGELGKKIFDHVSKEAWQMWLSHQTMLINENRLSAMEPKSREFLKQALQDYFFSDKDVKMPDGYIPPKE